MAQLARLAPLSLALLLAACSGGTGGLGPPQVQVHVLLEGMGKLGGCAIGELESTTPGPEVVAVGSDGRVHLVAQRSGAFVHEVVDTLPGEQIQVAAGRVGPRGLAGIVTVGAAEGSEDDGGQGSAWFLRRETEGWQRTELLLDSALIHAVDIADVDPNTPGNEVVLAGFSRQVHAVALGEGGPVSQVLGRLPGNAKGLSVAGDTVWVACDDGSLVALERGSAGWQARTALKHQAPLARIMALGGDVVYCGNDGRLRRYDGEQSGVLEFADDRLRGAVLWRGQAGNLWAASAGYDGRVLLHSTGFDASLSTLLHREDDKLHHLALGNVSGDTLLATCGYGGRLVWLRLSR